MRGHLKKINWPQVWAFWRDLMIYFVVFSFVGHWIEMAWALLGHWFLGTTLPVNILARFWEPYPVYGSGAVMAILLIYPLIKLIKKYQIPLIFLISLPLCAAVEYITAWTVVGRFGYNPYWDYSDRWLNLNGYICLQNCLLFALLATVLVVGLHPYLEKQLAKLPAWALNLACCCLLGVYLLITLPYLAIVR